MDPITLLFISGGATFLYDKYKEKKQIESRNGSTRAAKPLPPPMKFTDREALEFTRLRDGLRVFDTRVIDSPEIKKWLRFSSTELIPNGPPGGQAFMVLPFGAQPTQSASSVIQHAIDAGLTVIVTLSAIFLGQRNMNVPIMVVVGDEELAKLCNVRGDFALWPHGPLPEMKVQKSEPEEPAEASADEEESESEAEHTPTNGKAHVVQ